MGEDCRADDIVVAMDGVGTPNRWDPMDPMRDVCRCVIERVRKGEPLTRRSKLVAIRRGVPTVEDRAEVIVAQIFRSDAGDIGLDDLSDLLLERHDRDHCSETRL